MIGVCRYCGCTPEKPCVIPIELDGRLAIGAGGLFNARLNYAPCGWLLPDICDAPVCVERAYMDVRNSAEQLTQLLEEGIRIEFEDAA